MMSITERLAQFIVGTSFEQIPSRVIEIAENAILDCIGTILAGSREEPGRLVAELVRDYQGAPVSTVIGAGFKTAPPLAALANGTAAHALDFDDCSVGFHGHPSVATVPALLAAAEVCGATGRDLVTAYVISYEVGDRIGLAINPRHYGLRFHTTPTIGTFRATTAAARLFHLDVPTTRHALGIAASMCCGVNGNFGTMTKPLHAGLADENGVTAVQLAARGITANPRILETERGFCDAFCAGEGFNVDLIVENLGNPFCLEKPGVILKIYPCCRGGHPLISGILHMMQLYRIRAEDVERVRVGVNYMRPHIMRYGDPASLNQARFSMPYCASVAILDGQVGLAQFTEERLSDQAVHEFTKRVEVYVHPSMKDNLEQGAELDIILKDGRTYHHSVEVPWLKSSGAPVPREQVEAKFRGCAMGTLSPEDTEGVIQIIETLPQQRSLTGLMTVLGKSVQASKIPSE